MKKDRVLLVRELAEDLELVLQNKNEKFLAFTTDATKYEVLQFINEVASMLSGKKVAIATYSKQNLTGGIDNVVIDAKEADISKIQASFDDYDLVFVECPNVIKKHNYLTLMQFVKSAVIVAKEFDSRDEDVVKIKNILTEQNVDVLGIVYQK